MAFYLNLKFVIFELLSFLIFIKCDTDCSKRDSCEDKIISYPYDIGRGFDDRNCFCDEDCAEYNECCSDAPIKIPQSDNYGNHPYICQESGLASPIFVKVRCSNNWEKDYIHSSCENINELEKDPIKLLPVFDIRTNITYRNVYCAVCNGAEGAHLKAWQLTLSCSKMNIIKFYNGVKLIESIEFDSEEKHWKKLAKDSSGVLYTSLDCYGWESALTEFDFRYRMCKNNLHSTCPDTWKDDIIKSKCLTEPTLYRYLPVNFKHDTYRNTYCAQCNNVDENMLNCSLSNIYYTSNSYFQPHSVDIFMTYNFTKYKEENIFLQNKCPDGQLYDIKTKKCQLITCDNLISDVIIECKNENFIIDDSADLEWSNDI